MQVVYSKGPTQFQLSPAALERLKELGVEGYDEFGYNAACVCDIERHDPRLVQVVEELGVDSWGGYCELAIHQLKETRTPGKKEGAYYIHETEGYYGGSDCGMCEEVLEPHGVFWQRVVETIELTPDEREIAEHTASWGQLKGLLARRG
jgi:hypothetical protein